MWSLDYADGSANGYRFSRQGDGVRVDYTPVMAAESSSGLYTGGLPRTLYLDADATSALHEQVRALESIATPSDGGPRAKGTGHFEIVEPGVTRAFVVPAGPALQAFDAFLRDSGRVV